MTFETCAEKNWTKRKQKQSTLKKKIQNKQRNQLCCSRAVAVQKQSSFLWKRSG